MGKGRRVARKKQDKALQDAKPLCPLENTESSPLQENNEDVFCPKALAQANEGGDKDRTFDILGGSASPFSYASSQEVGISDDDGCKNGLFEIAELQEFPAFKRLEVGNSESLKKVSEKNGLPLVLSKGAGSILPVQSRDRVVFRNIDDKHLSLQLSPEEGHGGNAVSFDQSEADLMDSSKRLEFETGDDNNNSLECMHNENGTIQDMVITDNVTPHKFRDTGEGFPLISSQGLDNSSVDRKPATPDEDGVDWLSEQQNGHGKSTIMHNSELGTFEGYSLKDENGYIDRGLLEDEHSEMRSIQHSGSHDISERLVSHKSLPSRADDPMPSERLTAEAEKIDSPTSFEESCPSSAFEGVPGISSSGKLECSTIPGGEEKLGLAQRQSEHVKDVGMDILGQDDDESGKQVKDELCDFCLVGSEHDCVEESNQPKDANERNTTIQEAGTNMQKEEYPFFEHLAVPLPVVETEPSVNTSHIPVAADLKFNKSSGVVLPDNEVAFKGKFNDNNGSNNLGDINEEPGHQAQFLKLNGEEKDVAVHKKGESTDMFPQSKENVGRKLGFCGVLEFFLCWRD